MLLLKFVKTGNGSSITKKLVTASYRSKCKWLSFAIILGTIHPRGNSFTCNMFGQKAYFRHIQLCAYLTKNFKMFVVFFVFVSREKTEIV